MAKKEFKYPKCNTTCNSAIKIDNKDYCVMKLRDAKVAKESARLTGNECQWFRLATKSNTNQY